MDIQNLETQVQLNASDNNKRTKGFLIDIDIAGHLTDRERKILSNTAKRCEIGKMLSDNVGIHYQINFHASHPATNE